MEENNTFVSCMKIRGVSILPPLITPERRKELLGYKKKALLLEDLYQRRRSQISISEEELLNNVETERKIITLESDPSYYQDNVLEEVGGKYVPYETQLKEKPNLSIDITNVYECIPLPEVGSNVDLSESKYNETKKAQNYTNELFEKGTCHKLEDPSRPPLIRSNSYTLDNPSSVLLDHLKRHSSCDQTLTSDKNAEDNKSLEQNSKKHTERNAPPITDKNYPNSQPSFEVITTDITVQQINFTTSDINKEDATKTLSVCDTTELKYLGEDQISSSRDPEIELNAILQQIPENYAKKIMQLIEEQKKEQQRRTENYESIKTEMLQSGDFENKTSIKISSPKRIFVTSASNPLANTDRTKVVDSEMEKISRRSISLNSPYNGMEKSIPSSLNESQTLLFDMSTSTESLDDFSLRTIRILDLDVSNCPNQMNPIFSKEVISSNDDIMANYEMNKLKEREIQSMREEKAASIIGAYAKGYLVRRLMSTAKVKTIIQTIQDALVCALELQTSETIEEADVELHRRLIKLVSSACFDFHDIFFALTIREQMDIIAIDREKVKKAVAIRTTHSSTDFHSKGRTSSNIRSSQSLTKI